MLYELTCTDVHKEILIKSLSHCINSLYAELMVHDNPDCVYEQIHIAHDMLQGLKGNNVPPLSKEDLMWHKEVDLEEMENI